MLNFILQSLLVLGFPVLDVKELVMEFEVVDALTLQTLRQLEGLPGGKPALKCYLDQGGKPTIGYGHTCDVKVGDVITPEQAEQFLIDDAMFAFQAVDNMVHVKLNAYQRTALILFVFNEGIGNFSTSTLLRMLNDGYYNQVPFQLSRWIWVKKRDPKTNKIIGKVKSAGLEARRATETALWLTPDTEVTQIPSCATHPDTAGCGPSIDPSAGNYL